MDAEHKRPLAAFVVVTVASALLLGQSLSSQSPAGDDATTAAQASSRSNSSSAPSSGPDSGQAVDGVSATPGTATHTVKSIGRAPMLFARGDGGLGVAIGAVQDPAKERTDPVRTRDNPEAPSPQNPPEDTPATPPKSDPDGDGAPGRSGGHSQGPKGPQGPEGKPEPRNDGVLPTPQSHGPQ